MEIPKQQLGNTDISITPIGLGAWQFSEGKSFNSYIWDPLTQEETENIIQMAIDQGINWFDTAEMYGKGKSEKGLSSGLQKAGVKDEDVIIATKWWPLFRFASNIPKTIDTRVENLEPYAIDLYQVHQPWSFSFTKTEMEKMAEIADKGFIKSIGVSNFSTGKMTKAFEHLEKLDHQLASNQVKYSLLERDIESNGLIDAAKELNMTVIAYSPLEMGLLTGKFHEDPELLSSRPFFRRRYLKSKLDKSRDLIELLDSIATEHQVTISQVVLNWMISFHDNLVVIPGASKAKHIEQNAGAMKFKLSQEQLSAIDDASAQFL